jgi:hypothetical protein
MEPSPGCWNGKQDSPNRPGTEPDGALNMWGVSTGRESGGGKHGRRKQERQNSVA